MHTWYHPPLAVDALLPDQPADAAASDHLGNILIPRSVPGISSSSLFRKMNVRPLSSSQIEALGRWIGEEKCDALRNTSDVDSQLELFTTTVFTMLNAVAPEKEIKISLDDPPWMNTRIKTIVRQRSHEYDKNTKSDK